MTLLGKALTHWRGFTMGSVNRRIFSAMVVIMAATFLVKVAAVAKDIVMAGKFGLTDEVDAFLMALAIPALAVSVIAQSFNGSFMPAYIRVREREGPPAAKRLFASVIVLNFGIMLACTGVLAAFSGPLLDLVTSEFTPQKRAHARDLYFVLLPLLVIEGQLSLWSAVLNAGEKFALAAFAPILTPLIIIVLLLSVSGTIGIEAVAWGTVWGTAAEVAVLGFALAQKDLLPVPRWHRGIEESGEVLRQYFPLVCAAMIMNSSTLIDQVMASWLGSGSVAALNYGNKVPAFLSGIGLTALGTAVLPHFSRLVALGDYAAIRHTLKTYTWWILVLTLPLTCVFMLGSEWIIRIAFQRGAFRPEDTALVSFVQQMYLLQVPFLVVGLLGVRVLVAMSKNHLLTFMSIVNLLVNCAGNYVFMQWFGAAGIALSTSLVYVVSMTMILVLVSRSLRALERERPAA